MLVWDGTDEVRIPTSMGTPRADQMQGTCYERLAELAGRVCYDSLGKGRSSLEYHKHIQEVGHFSVYEHCMFTFETNDYEAVDFLNRPGLYVDVRGFSSYLNWRLTLNPRTVISWGDFGVTKASEPLVPAEIGSMIPLGKSSFGKIVQPMNSNEAWVSLYLVGSRGFSHELVRHGDFTAISQRSTRYVDESDSEWVEHPILKEYLKDLKDKKCFADVSSIEHKQNEVIQKCKGFYTQLVGNLESWLVSKEIDRGTARKQARGAARGYLGNALQTELIFSASMSQWNRMIEQRFNKHADAEIREVFGQQVIPALKKSRYSEFLVVKE